MEVSKSSLLVNGRNSSYQSCSSVYPSWLFEYSESSIWRSAENT